MSAQATAMGRRRDFAGDPGVTLLPLIVVWVLGLFVPFFMTAWGPLDADNWRAWVWGRIAWQLGSSVLLAGLVGRMLETAWRGLALGVAVGLALSGNALLDAARGPIEGELLSSEITREHGVRGATSAARLVVRTPDRDKHVLHPGAVSRWAGAVAECEEEDRPVEWVQALERLDVVLARRCGEGALIARCEEGEAEACARAEALAERLVDERRPTTAERTARAARLFFTSCRAGDAASCTRAGHLVLRGAAASDGGRDPARAAALYRTACDAGEGDACGVLGELVGLGDGITADPVQAAQLFRRACAAGYTHFCGRTPSSPSSTPPGAE